MRVAVYKNLRLGCWSIAEVSAAGNRGRLIRHADHVALSDVVFVVKESRRQHVIAAKCREVHAWCVGEIVGAGFGPDAAVEVTYNPYRAPYFTLRDGTPVHRAAVVHFTREGIAQCSR